MYVADPYAVTFEGGELKTLQSPSKPKVHPYDAWIIEASAAYDGWLTENYRHVPSHGD
jgi:hypothetical protein